jgi:hypothetical protein
MRPWLHGYHLVFFYPISPRLALFLGEVSGVENVPEVIKNEEIIIELNLRIARASYSQVYASTAEELVSLRELMERST